MCALRIFAITYLLLCAVCGSAQKAKGKLEKNAENYEPAIWLDDTSKQVLINYAAQYDSAVFLESSGGYADQPELNGFGFKKGDVYKLRVSGDWVAINHHGYLHIGITAGSKVTADTTLLKVREINLRKLQSLNPDSLYAKEMVCCDVPYFTLWLFRGAQYVLRGHQLWTPHDTGDKKVFSDEVQKLIMLVDGDKY
jgi:hypothetical protein